MILKGSQRGGGQNLAAHLTRTDDNEHVLIHDLRGFSANDLHGAFKEAEAISRGTKCRQYLFSLSLNPPTGEHVELETFDKAIGNIEQRLGLEGQPRAIVIHEKEGRRHMHCVWSRIDCETMTARPLPFFKSKMMAVSRDLYLEHGWSMPKGMIDAAKRDPTNFTLEEWQQGKRLGADPRWLKLVAQDCWSRSDSRPAFQRALQEHGLFLARGDSRSLVLVDYDGEVRSLSRTLGLKSPVTRARLGDGYDLPDVSATKAEISGRMTPSIRRHVTESRERFAKRSSELGALKDKMTLAHRTQRSVLAQRQSLEWQQETLARSQRLPKGLRGIWHRITGKFQQVRSQNEREAEATQLRQAGERQALFKSQIVSRSELQKEIKQLRSRHASELVELRKEVGRFMRMTNQKANARAQRRPTGLGLRLGR